MLEKLDEPSLPFEEAERSLRDLGWINRLLLGALPLKRTILPRLGRWSEPRRVLDLGTGTGAVAEDLARAAARRGAPLKVVGLDLKLRHLVIGRRSGSDQLRVVADATALPFRDGAFEWSFSTLFFHHFEAEANLRVLAEMSRVSRAGAAVVDLRPSRLAPPLLLAFQRLHGRQRGHPPRRSGLLREQLVRQGRRPTDRRAAGARAAAAVSLPLVAGVGWNGGSVALTYRCAATHSFSASSIAMTPHGRGLRSVAACLTIRLPHGGLRRQRLCSHSSTG